MNALQSPSTGASSGNEALLRVLWGEAAPESLADPTERQRAKQGLDLLRSTFAIPPLVHRRLRAALEANDRETAARIFQSRPLALPRLCWAAVAAVVLLGCGALLAFAWVPLRQVVWGPTNQEVPEQELPSTNPKPRPERLPEGRWRLADGITVAAAQPQDLAVGSEGVLVLNSGRADIVTQGILEEPVSVLQALDAQVRLYAHGPSQCAIRLTPGMRGVGCSVMEGAPGSVLVQGTATELAFGGGQNMDAVLTRSSTGTKMERLIVWKNVRTALPPVSEGVVLLRLLNGRVLRGCVTRSYPEGVLLIPSAVDRSTEETPANRTEIPESVHYAEIAAWVPAETPRGRDTYAQWLAELLPLQLRSAAINSTWNMYLAEREVRPKQASWQSVLHITAAYPEVAYGLRQADGALFFCATPFAPDLGLGWELDERGQVARSGAATPQPGEPDF